MGEQGIKETMQQALDDCLNIYAEELCDPSVVALARKRIECNGGTLAYIAGITQNLREAIKDCEQADKQEPIATAGDLQLRKINSLDDNLELRPSTPLYTHPSSVCRLKDGDIVRINNKKGSIFSKAYAIMDACNIPKEGE